VIEVSVRLHELLDGLDGVSWRGDGPAPDPEVRAVEHDSRAVRPGALFCCIPGSVTDGHLHAPTAVERGAAALLVERFLPLDVAQARVPSVRAAVGPVAARFHRRPSRSMRVLGVTGTNGKTTTTHLVEAIGTAAGEPTAVVGTVGTRIAGTTLPQARTTPEATELQALFADLLHRGTGIVAMEVSSHALDLHRVDGTEFAAVGFTNLGRDHLDWHGSMEAYFESKARLFTMAFAPAAAVNVADPWGRQLAARAERDGLEVVGFGEGGAVRAVATRLDSAGTDLVLADARTRREASLRLPLVGEFNVANAEAAAALALAAQLPWEAVVAGLTAPVVVPGRLEPVPTDQGFSVFVDYAHTPDALERVLAALRAVLPASGRIIAVFGAGGDRDRGKRPLMGAAVAAGADLAFLTSDNPRSEDPAAIAHDVLEGVPAGAAVQIELDRRRAIREAIAAARPGDIVLVAGKGHETGQSAAGRTTPFDDRLVARQELEALGCA
jgi:UDP-N-acetylmuramoyl-L-alanyl-D-glutamate--2,6-diaminopimelate ligase